MKPAAPPDAAPGAPPAGGASPPRRFVPDWIPVTPPLPSWLAVLAGGVDAPVETRPVGTGVQLRLGTGADRRVLALDLRVPAAPRCHRLAPEGPPLPEPAFAPLATTAQAALARFVARAEWVAAVRVRRPSLGAHRPTADERALAALRVAAGATPPAPVEAAAEASATADLTLGWRWLATLAAGDLDALLPDANGRSPADAAPPWARAFALGLLGRREDLSALAAEATTAPPGLETLRALALQQLGYTARARELLAASVEGVPWPERAHALLALADLHRDQGDLEAAAAALRRAAPGLLAAPDDALRLVERQQRLGAFDDAARTLERAVELHPGDGRCRLALARHRLWCGDTAAVHAELAALAGHAELALDRRTLEAGLSVLERRLDDARAALEEVLTRRPDDPELHTWLAEVSLRQGRWEATLASLTRARNLHETPVHTLLEELRQRHIPHPVAPVLARLCQALGLPEAPPDPPLDHAVVLSWLDRCIAPFGGNRSPLPTRVVLAPGTPTPRRLVPFQAPQDDEVLSGRHAAAEQLKRLRVEPVEAVLAGFAALQARFPGSPHPLCYRGELYLWLGRNDEAFADFAAAFALLPTRWGLVGRAAVCILEGRFEEARGYVERCAARYPAVPSATTPVYVGEMLRREGDLEGARRELGAAVRSKPGRFGAWIQLALVELARGDRAAAEACLGRLQRHVPVLLRDAHAELSPPATPWPLTVETMAATLEHALVMLRGNRSSHLITYFDRTGALRIAQDAAAWSRLARQSSVWVQVEVDRRLGRFP